MEEPLGTGRNYRRTEIFAGYIITKPSIYRSKTLYIPF